MLKERVKKLMDRYESGDENLTAMDVRDELDEIIDDEPWEEPLTVELTKAVFTFTTEWRESQKYGGRVDDGGDDFIAEVERIICYNG